MGKKKKKKKIINDTAFPVAVQKFREFLCRHDPLGFSRHFKSAFFDHLFLTHGDGFAEEFNDYIIEVHDILEIMDIAIIEDTGKIPRFDNV